MTVTIREQELSAIMDALSRYVDDGEEALANRDLDPEDPAHEDSHLRHARAVLGRVEEAFQKTVGIDVD
jgi:hypothetical protein